jgi:hypothetical protein
MMDCVTLVHLHRRPSLKYLFSTWTANAKTFVTRISRSAKPELSVQLDEPASGHYCRDGFASLE